MTNEFVREERYIVFKISDVVEHLTTTEALHLARLYEVQRVGRREAGKAELECVVVEADWPEYEPTWKAVEARVTGAQQALSVPDGWKLAPIVSTAEMDNAGADHCDGYWSTAQAVWDAMLAAAPEAKP